MDGKRLVRAAAVAFLSQGITAAVNALTVFMLAGKLSAAEYGLWQFFVLLGSYSGLFHLGLCDGVYLNNGGRELRELDAPKLGTLFRRSFVIQIVVAILLIPALLRFGGARDRIWAMALALVYMPIFNADAYLGHILQATGNTEAYSVSVIIDRVSFFAFAVLASVSGFYDFRAYAVAGILAESVSLAYCIYKTRGIVFAPRARSGIASMARRDISVGSRLMISNLSGQLVQNAARIAVIWRYGDAEFGRISFVMTLANVFLQLLSQMSMVLFPSLRREDETARLRFMSGMRSAVGLILPAVFLAYVPLRIFVAALLPNFESGMEYLVLLLPMCLLDGKTNLVATTYFKVRGKAGELMLINLLSAAFGITLCLAVAGAGGDVGAILAAAVVVSAVRYATFELRCRRLERQEDREVTLRLFSELALCGIFVLATIYMSDIYAALFYLISYFIYLFVRRRELARFIPIHK